MPELAWKPLTPFSYVADHSEGGNTFHCYMTRKKNRWIVWHIRDDGVNHPVAHGENEISITHAREHCEQMLDRAIALMRIPDILVVLDHDDTDIRRVLTRLPDLVAKIGKPSDYPDRTFPYVAYEW